MMQVSGLLRPGLAAGSGSPLLVLVVSSQVPLMPAIGHSSALHAMFLSELKYF